MIQTSICMPFSCPPPCPGCDTLPAEFPTLPEQQDELQLGVRDTPVSGLHLWKHNRRTWASWSVHKREKRGADQPDTGKFDRVLSGAMPRKPGNVSVAGQSSPCLPMPAACALLGSALSLLSLCCPTLLLTWFAWQSDFGLAVFFFINS